MSLHPATKILLWLICAVVAQWLQPLFLLILTLMLAIALLAYRASLFFTLLRRTRWILLALCLVYAFATPGMYLLPTLGGASPTLEGVREGGMQLWRLSVVLAALAVLLGRTPREELLAGLYVLMKPLRPLGVDAERFALRLWLTLRYAEAPRARAAEGNWLDRLQRALEPGNETDAVLRLEVRPLRWVDWGIVLAVMALSVAVA